MHDRREGFRHKGLIVYALQYDLEGTPRSSLIIWLDEHGDSLHPWNQPAQSGRRMVTAKPGDVILHNGERKTVAGVSIYRALGVEPGVEVVG